MEAILEKFKDPKWGAAKLAELAIFKRFSESELAKLYSFGKCFLLDADKFSRYLEQMGENLQLRFYKTCAEDLAIRLRNLNSDYISSQNALWRYTFRQEK